MATPTSVAAPGPRVRLPMRQDPQRSSQVTALHDGGRRAPDHAASPPSTTGRRRDAEYEHLYPLLTRYAHLDAEHPDRRELRERLARGFRPLATHIAARYRGRGEPLEDLEQAGALGLVTAIDRFDPDHGRGFLAFAIPTITGEIRRHFRDRTWSVHVPRRIKELQSRMAAAQQTLSGELGRAPRVSELAAHLDLGREDVIDALAAHESYKAASLDVPVGESDTPLGNLIGGPDIRIEVIDARESVRPALEKLPERERTILRLRFFENMTQTEVAEQVGISQMHVSRLLARTLAGLRGHLTADPDELQ